MNRVILSGEIGSDIVLKKTAAASNSSIYESGKLPIISYK